MKTLFDITAFEKAGFTGESERPPHFCRTCEHREPWQCGGKINNSVLQKTKKQPHRQRIEKKLSVTNQPVFITAKNH